MLNDTILDQLIETRGKHSVIKLFIQAKAKKSQFLGIHDGRLKLAISAPPIEGKANREVIAFMASYFGVRKNQVKIISGERSRRKTCIVESFAKKEAIDKLLNLS